MAVSVRRGHAVHVRAGRRGHCAELVRDASDRDDFRGPHRLGQAVEDSVPRSPARTGQESDRVMAAVMTAFGRPTGDLTIDGRGTMTGVMLGALTSPRIEAAFAGDAIDAWNVEWGRGAGDIVVEDSVLEVTGARFRQAASSLAVDGRFAIGAARSGTRADSMARFEVDALPAQYIRDAFELEGYTIGRPDVRPDPPVRGLRRAARLRADATGRGPRLRRALRRGGSRSPIRRRRRLAQRPDRTAGETVRSPGRCTCSGTAPTPSRPMPAACSSPRRGWWSAFRVAVAGRIAAAISGAGAFADPRYEIRGTMADVTMAGCCGSAR